MRLPDLVAYQAAVQHPSTAFADPQLRAATVTTGNLGLPRAVAGNFAVTYQLRAGGATVGGALLSSRGRRPSRALRGDQPYAGAPVGRAPGAD